MTPEDAISAAWNEWLKTDDHLFGCIGYSEGQLCCAEPDERQAELIRMALDALRSAGYLREVTP